MPLTGLRLAGPSGTALTDGAVLGCRDVLLDAGVHPGELVGVRGPTAVDQVTGFLGAALAGAVPAMLPPRVPAGDVGARDLEVTDGRTRPGQPVPGTTELPDDACYVQLSGGTTGEPTAVVVRRGALEAQLQMYGASMPAGSVSVGWLPLHHDMGMISQLLTPLAREAASVVVDAGSWLRDPTVLLDAVERSGGTHTWMPSFGFAHTVRRVAVDARPRDLSSLRVLGCGGEPADPHVLEAFLERFVPWGLDPDALIVGYGMAEAVCGVTLSPGTGLRTADVELPDRLGGQVRLVGPGRGRRLCSCGAPSPSLQVQVRDGDTVLPDLALGEVVLRGRGLAGPRASGGPLRELAGRDGWLRTGDAGFLHAGHLWVTDRLDDCLLVAGRNVQPAHVEQVATRAAGASAGRVAAFGVDDARGRRRLVVVCEDRAAVDEQTARATAGRVRRAVLTGCGVLPVAVEVAVGRAVLSGSSGKASRPATRAAWLAARRGRAVELGIEDVRDLLSSMDGSAPWDTSTPLADAGLDSLALVELQDAWESAGGDRVDVARLPAGATLGDLLVLLGLGVEAPACAPAPAEPAPPEPSRPRALPARLLDRGRGPVLRGRALPYAAGRRVLAAAAASPHLRDAVAGDELELVATCLVDLGRQAEQEVLRRSFEVNLWQGWWRAATADRQVRRRWLSIVGEEHLHGPAGTLVLVPHTPLHVLLRHHPVVGRALVIAGDGTTPGQRAARFSQARDVLRAGGCVVLFPDEFLGVGGIDVEVAGRVRPLRLGLGRLVEQTGARAVPWSCTAGPSWTLTSSFGPPLTATSGADLVHEYAGHLDTFWRDRLELVDWRTLRRHLRMSRPVLAAAG